MTASELVISKIGGVRKTARALGLNPSTVCRWRKPAEEGGTGGMVPQIYFRAILDLIGKEITLEQLCFGDKQ
jgi:transposase-like protein